MQDVTFEIQQSTGVDALYTQILDESQAEVPSSVELQQIRGKFVARWFLFLQLEQNLDKKRGLPSQLRFCKITRSDSMNVQIRGQDSSLSAASLRRLHMS